MFSIYICFDLKLKRVIALTIPTVEMGSAIQLPRDVRAFMGGEAGHVPITLW
jgi:hypothetical protein